MEEDGSEIDDAGVLLYVRCTVAYESPSAEKPCSLEVGDVFAVVEEKPATGWCAPPPAGHAFCLSQAAWHHRSECVRRLRAAQVWGIQAQRSGAHSVLVSHVTRAPGVR
jgi:hypothetical protein